MQRRLHKVSSAPLAVSLGIFLALTLPAPAGSAETTSLNLVEHATTDTVTDTGAKGDSAGDLLTFANEVFDAKDAQKVGTSTGWCIRTVAGKSWECFWTLTLADGQITVEGPFLDSGELGHGRYRRHRQICRRARRDGAPPPRCQGQRL